MDLKPPKPDAQRLTHDVAQLLYHEARLLDERRFAEWLSLFTEDARYWCPCENAADPLRDVSVFFDDAARMAERVFRLENGPAFAQDPPSKTRRLITNIQCEADGDATHALIARSNFIIGSFRRDHQDVWIGEYEHHLRRVDDNLRISFKKVSLINSGAPLNSLAFLL
jgi:3-phenylpropionate/cinnamic acid dioxygenase small subunit